MKKRVGKYFLIVAGVIVGLVILGGIIFSLMDKEVLLGAGMETKEFTGKIEMLFYDDFLKSRNSKIVYHLNVDGERYKLESFSPKDKLSPNSVYSISGKLIGNKRIEVIEQKYKPLLTTILSEENGARNVITGRVISGSTNSDNIGGQKTLVAMVNFNQSPNDKPYTSSQVYNEIFSQNNPSSTNNFIQENSYGKTWLTGNVFGWYTLSMDYQGCDVYPQGHPARNEIRNNILDSAIESVDPFVSFVNDGYGRLIILFPSEFGCDNGWGTIGMWNIQTDDGLVPLSISFVGGRELIEGEYSYYYKGVVRHELGHNLGLYHASDLECGENVIGTCPTIEYGDSFDTMGGEGGNIVGHYNVLHKELIGWLDDEISIFANGGNDLFYIYPLETFGKGLKIPLANGDNYYVDYRRPIGFDTKIKEIYGDDILDGVFIYLDGYIPSPENAGGSDSRLLDNSPSTDNQFFDSINAVLRQGESFVDEENGITIFVEAIGSNAAVVKVTAQSNNCLPVGCFDSDDIPANDPSFASFFEKGYTCKDGAIYYDKCADDSDSHVLEHYCEPDGDKGSRVGSCLGNGCITESFSDEDPTPTGFCSDSCGNNICDYGDFGETCASCSQDCGSCGTVCGDNVCEEGETCSNCLGDCGTCLLNCNENIINLWHLDEISGATAYDSIGSSHGTNIDVTINQDGMVGSSYYFDGLGEYVELPNSASLKGANQFTIEMWIYNEGSGWRGLYHECSNSVNPATNQDCLDRIFIVKTADNGINAMIRDNDINVNSKIDLLSGSYLISEWNHLAVVYDSVSDVHKLYLNGVLRDSRNVNLGTLPNTLPIEKPTIGVIRGLSHDLYFLGRIDEVAIYKRALSGSEIVEHYEN
ncbi:hypothetical protein J4462_00225, partial [Candidatus Pacearchaeota archaeon]|nr:hypothetical protein [Candidatus Pacearchaeota archaeon]